MWIGNKEYLCASKIEKVIEDFYLLSSRMVTSNSTVTVGWHILFASPFYFMPRIKKQGQKTNKELC